MKRWSIKKKIIFWYTIFFGLLIVFDFYFLQASATRVLHEQANREITNATVEVADMLKIEDDGVYIEESDDEEKFSFYHDGVLFLVYDSNQVVFGQTPSNFNEDLAIQFNTIQLDEVNGQTWLTYDVSIEDGYILRGIYDLNPITNSVSQIILIAGILSPIIILLAAIGGYVIIKKSFKPIQVIYHTASVIKDNEDYSKRIETNFSKDEVYELALMVNQMLDRVEQSINREKQFSSNVSHELRTPLTVMKAQTEYLLEKVSDPHIIQDVNTIMSQISFMENIVTQLLEITRTKQISDQDKEAIEFYELIKLTGESLQHKLEEKHITLNITEPTEHTTVYVNQTMMIRVVSNLITNAIKYNKEGGSIQIDFLRQGNILITSFSDTGIGISKKHMNNIFDPFYRADEARTQQDDSLGLGLALVKEIIRIHNGEIRVESQESAGTTFTVHLPLVE